MPARPTRHHQEVMHRRQSDGLVELLLALVVSVVLGLLGGVTETDAWSNYGSGAYGNWSGDEYGLPRYTVAKGSAAIGAISKANGGFLYQFGNDRHIVMAMADGSVSMRQDEGGAKLLNARDTDHGQHGGGLGFLSEDDKLLLHTLDNGTGGVEMQLGVGYFRKRVHSEAAMLSLEHSIIAPHGDLSFAVIVINTTNHAERKRTIKYAEVWSRLMRELHEPRPSEAHFVKEKIFSAAEFAAAVTHRVRRAADGSGLFDAGLPPSGGPPEPPPDSLFPAASEHDYHPVPTFLRVIDDGGAPTRLGCNGTALFPYGSSLPDLINGFHCDSSTIHGPETLLALELEMELPASSSTVRYLAFGYVAPGHTHSSAVPAAFLGKHAADAWRASSFEWRAQSITFAAPEVGDWLERETLWHSHALRAALTHDSYWGGSTLDQNGGYMYRAGDAGVRDALNHALPLLFYGANATRSGICMAVASTHNKMFSGGRMPKATFGFGLGFGVGKDSAAAKDRDGWCCYPSDLELWILNAAIRYVLVTRDFEFLAEPVRSIWGVTTMADALWRIVHHLMEVPSADGGVGLGPHGLLKVLTMDYNDGILLAPGNQMNVSLNNRSAESVLNSAQAVGILSSYSAILAALPPSVGHRLGDVTANISHLRVLESQQRKAVAATWGGAWFSRMWAPDSGWFGTEHNDSIWWSNAFPLLHSIPPVDQPAQADRLVSAIDNGLLSSNPTGVPFSNKSAHADYQDSWFAASMYMIEGLGQRGYQDLAFKAWKKGLLSTHATKYPSQFAGIWGASDHYADAGLHGTPQQQQQQQQHQAGGSDVAIFNSWAHTTPLWGALALVGAEFDVDGVIVRPTGLQPTVALGTLGSYNLSTPVLGVVRTSRPALIVSGWYRPLVRGACSLRVVLNAEAAKILKTLTVNGRSTPLVVKQNVVEIRAPTCDIRWELRTGATSRKKLDDEAAASISPRLSVGQSSSPPPQLVCSYNGFIPPGRDTCVCEPPWFGLHCNDLPPAPAAPHSAADFYRARLGHTDISVAECASKTDCTDGLNAALNNSGVVVVPVLRDSAGRAVPWRVRGFVFRSDNARVVFAAGVEVQALKNATYLFACKPVADLATAHNRRNLTVVGYGASWRMWRQDYVRHCKHSEFRMGWSIDNCTDVEVAGLTIRETGGDGLIVMSNVWQCQNYSRSGLCTKGTYFKQGATRNLLVRDVVLDRNYRQGMSVISAENMVVINTTFSNTNGTAPSAGVDLEPDSSHLLSDHLRLTNITFVDCQSINNTGAGFAGYFAGLLGAKGSWAQGVPPTTIRFIRCTVLGGQTAGWSWGALYPDLAGNITISGGRTSGTSGWGVHVMNKALSSLPISYVNHTFDDVARGPTDVECSLGMQKKGECLAHLINNPINLGTRAGTPQLQGGVAFRHCRVIDRLRARPWFQLIGSKATAWSDVNVTDTAVYVLSKADCPISNITNGIVHSTDVKCLFQKRGTAWKEAHLK